jgi:hypothetical protein
VLNLARPTASMTELIGSRQLRAFLSSNSRCVVRKRKRNDRQRTSCCFSTADTVVFTYKSLA